MGQRPNETSSHPNLNFLSQRNAFSSASVLKTPQRSYLAFGYAVRVATTIFAQTWLREEYGLELTWGESVIKDWLKATNNEGNNYFKNLEPRTATSRESRRCLTF